MAFVASDLLFPAVKNWKSVNIWQSEGQYFLGITFFGSAGIGYTATL